jgi:UPF0755 protein
MGIDRGLRPESVRREALANAGQRARDRTAAGYEVRNSNYRPRAASGERTRGGRWLPILLAVAALVVIAWCALPPLAGGLFRALAEENPDLMRIGFIEDSVAAVMDGRPDAPAGTDATPVEFVIAQGTSSRQITDDLVQRDLVTDRLAFSWVLASENRFDDLRFGRHILNRTMSPRQVVGVLTGAPVTGNGSTGVSVALRQGLRVEQIVAYLQTLPLENLDVDEFFTLAKDPPRDLRDKFEWLKVVPQGRSVEGFLGAGVFDVEPDTNAREMLELLLQRWQDSPSFALINQAQSHGLDFYSTVILASIVERETTQDDERDLVAGVYQNRVNGLNDVRTLNADPVLIYAKDTMRLRDMHISEWPNYVFWSLDGIDSAQDFVVAPDLAGYHTWHSRGLPPGPISTPGFASLQAALNPNTADGFLYFVAKGDSSNSHAFAKTYEEHLQNIKTYYGTSSPGPQTSPQSQPQQTDVRSASPQ